MTKQAHLVNICNQTQQATVDQDRLRQGILLVLQEHEVKRAVIGLAIVTDLTIHKMNRQYLDHDYTTDVLSFPLSSGTDDVLEGEIAISFDTAKHHAEEYRWDTEDELLLYAIHGTLHLVGFSDQFAEERDKMRYHERAILAKMNVVYPEDSTPVARDRALNVIAKSDCPPLPCADPPDPLR